MNKVSVIIPAVNEESHIGRCVASAQDAGCDEIIVSDGGSSDRTAQIARSLGSQVVQGPRGRAVQQNMAAELAQGEILLFLHADSWLASTACDQIRQAVRDPKIVCGAFRQRIDADGLTYRLLEYGNAARVRWRGFAYGDQGIFVRREMFTSVGGFSRIRILEDLLLMRQLRKTAWPVLLPGPIHVSPRRWQRYGVVRQTLRNGLLLASFRLGVPPDRLAEYYARHDE